MQGTAADIIKRAMVRVDIWLSESGLDAKVILQVHDELVYENSEKEAEGIAQRLKNVMETVVSSNVLNSSARS